MTTIQLRRASASAWAAANPVLELGEAGVETDTYKIKVGDGTSLWDDLPYFVHSWSDITGKPVVIASGANQADARAAISAAALDSNGRVPIGQLPASLMQYQGLWDAESNTPTLVNGTGDIGDVYRVTVAGARNLGSGSISFGVGDYVILNNSEVWEKSDTTDAVSTVAGRIGNVVLTAADVVDANGNIAANNHIEGLTSISTNNGTTTLTAASPKIVHFTGSSNQILVLPSTGIAAGHQFVAINNSSGSISGRSSNESVIHVLGPSVECVFTALVNEPTLPEHWEDSFYGANFAEGKVLSVNSTLTLAGTDGTVFTFPAANDTVVGIAATQTLSNKTLSSVVLGTPSSGNVNSCVGQVADLSIVAFGAATIRAVGTGDFPFGIKLQRACLFEGVHYRAATADGSGSLTVELRKNGVALAQSQVTIAAGSQVAGTSTVGSWSFASGDIITVYVTAIGGSPGKGLIADIRGKTV